MADWQDISTAETDGRYYDTYNAFNGQRRISRWIKADQLEHSSALQRGLTGVWWRVVTRRHLEGESERYVALIVREVEEASYDRHTYSKTEEMV